MCLGWSLLFFFFLFFFLSLGQPFKRTSFHLPRILGDYIEDEFGGAYRANGRDWQQPLVGQGLVIIEVSRSHSDTPHSVGLFRTSDRPDTKTSTLPQTTLTIDGIHALGGIRTRSASRRAAAATCLRLRGRWDRQEIRNTSTHSLPLEAPVRRFCVFFLLIEGCCQLHCIALETRLYCTRSTFSNLIVSVACAFV